MWPLRFVLRQKSYNEALKELESMAQAGSIGEMVKAMPFTEAKDLGKNEILKLEGLIRMANASRGYLVWVSSDDLELLKWPTDEPLPTRAEEFETRMAEAELDNLPPNPLN